MTRVDAAAIGAASDVTSQRKPVHVDGQRREGGSVERRLGRSSRLVTFAKEAEHLVAEGLRILEQKSVTGIGVDDQPGVGDRLRQGVGLVGRANLDLLKARLMAAA